MSAVAVESLYTTNPSFVMRPVAKASLPLQIKTGSDVFLCSLETTSCKIGYPILQEVVSKEQRKTSDPVFICKGKDALATGRMTNDGFVVYKDSTATADISRAVIERNQKVIEKLVLNKYLEKGTDNLYVFIKDYVFNSPSAASDIILGNSTSGWKKWRTESRKTLEEIYKK